jgi:hypothetical protein
MVVNVKGDAPSLSLFTRPYLHNSLYNNQLQRSGLDCTSSWGNNALVISDPAYFWIVPLTRKILTIAVATRGDNDNNDYDYYFRPGKIEETSFPLNLPSGMGTY